MLGEGERPKEKAQVPVRGGICLSGSHKVLTIYQTNYLVRQTGAKTRTAYFCTALAFLKSLNLMLCLEGRLGGHRTF